MDGVILGKIQEGEGAPTQGDGMPSTLILNFVALEIVRYVYKQDLMCLRLAPNSLCSQG